jgi:hypothetical protein
MVRPRRSSAASEESAGTARDQVYSFLRSYLEVVANATLGTRKYVRLPREDHIIRTQREWKVGSL